MRIFPPKKKATRDILVGIFQTSSSNFDFCILLFLEPDYGATIVLFSVGMVVLFCGGAKNFTAWNIISFILCLDVNFNLFQ